MQLNDFIIKAIDVPFKTHGRDYDGWDCWGLVYVGYKDMDGIILPSYTSGEYKNVTRDRKKIKELCIATAAENWQQVTNPQPKDVVILYIEGLPVHVALMIDSAKLLHVEQGVNTCVQRLKDFRVEGIYRYNGKRTDKT